MTKEQSARNIRLAEALESGKYKQGNSKLRDGNRFCCIGVACDVLDPKGWKADLYMGEQSYAPLAVQEYYGWREKNPIVTVSGRSSPAAFQNDIRGRSFSEIAQGFRLLAAEMTE